MSIVNSVVNGADSTWRLTTNSLGPTWTSSCPRRIDFATHALTHGRASPFRSKRRPHLDGRKVESNGRRKFSWILDFVEVDRDS